MALIKSDVLFRIFPAECSNELKVSLRPNEHYKVNDEGELCTEYTCQLCENLTEKQINFLRISREKMILIWSRFQKE